MGGGVARRSRETGREVERRAGRPGLSAAGYRPRGGVSHHVWVIRSLAETVGADSAVVRQFNAARKKRHVGTYDNTGVISDQEADA